MKKYIMIILAAILFVGCDEEEVHVYEGSSFAELTNSEGTLIINPSSDTENVFNVGVTATTNQDRTYAVSISEESTLDPSFYSISGLEGTIKAGEYVGDIVVTTFATSDFPPSGAELILNFESVASTPLLDGGDTTLTLGFEVACPEVNLEDLVGTHTVQFHRFDDFFAGAVATREVTLGPEENQITIVGGAVVQDGADDLILTIDPNTGAVSYGGPEGAFHFNSFGSGVYGSVNGRVLTCIGFIDITISSPGFIDNFLTLQL